METIAVKYVKPGTEVKVPTMEELDRMVQDALYIAARKQFRAACAVKRQAVDEIARLTVQRKMESDRLAKKLAELRRHKEWLVEQKAYIGIVAAAVEAVHDQYEKESAANDGILRVITEAQERRTAAVQEMLALRKTHGWQILVLRNAAVRKAEALKAQIQEAIRADKTPDADTPLGDAVAQWLAEEPAEEKPAAQPINKTQRRKANKAPKREAEHEEPEAEECHVKAPKGRSTAKAERDETLAALLEMGLTLKAAQRAVVKAENA